MTDVEIKEIYENLISKGFKLDEITDRHLRMERHREGDHCLFEVLFAPTVLPTAIRWNGKKIIKIIKSFEELKSFLEETFAQY